MTETIPIALAELAAVLVAAAIGGHFARRLGQPAVLGELAVGVLLAAVVLVAPQSHFAHLLEAVREEHSYVALLAELGLVLLLFEVGLETRFEALIGTGWTAVRVATLGVFLPFGLGILVSGLLVPGPLTMHLFVGASLAATSVGLTARVFRELGKLDSAPARIVLAAAVLDDVLGLILLSVVSGVATGAEVGASQIGVMVATTTFKAVAFLGAAVFVGQRLAPRMFLWMSRLKGRGLVVTTSMAFCFGAAWLADLFGLAPIVGAFVAGLVLNDTHLLPFKSTSTTEALERRLTPVSQLFVPVFFVYVGVCIDLAAVSTWRIVGIAALLSVGAVIGKMLSGLMAPGSAREKLTVGIAMVPRGEVGLIFATIGVQQGVLDQGLYGAVVLMVVVTTAITPPLLKRVVQGGPTPTDSARSVEPTA